MPSNLKKRGSMSKAEAEKNRRALELLKHVSWARRLANEVQKDDPTQGILFELRFAYEIERLRLVPEYEHKTGVDDTSVDFRLAASSDVPAWNVELVSLDRSKAVEKATISDEGSGLHVEILDLGLPGDPCEDARRIHNKQTVEHEMLRAISALEKKVYDAKKQRPIKFPIPDGLAINMLLVDVRLYEGMGFLDRDHCRQIVGGSAIVKHDLNVHWDPDSDQPIRGLWSVDNDRAGARHARERIHVIGFVHEEVYDDDEIREVTVLFQNPHLPCDGTTYPLRWATPPEGQSTPLRQENTLWNSR
jgi:hypothetical protein